MTSIPRSRPLAALAVLVLAFALAGCFNPFSPRIATTLGNSKPAPVPTSATNLLRLFEWCYNNQAIAEYREIFTDDYEFFFSPTDSAGSEWRGTPWRREDELISATQLFVGGSATEPPASSIRLSLDKNFFVFPDPNFTAWDLQGRWHKNIRTTVTLVINTEGGSSTEIQGHGNFYMIRGDSAVIPDELKLRGFGPDSNRWYIRRWDDETAQEGLAQAVAAARARELAADRASVPATAGRPAAVTSPQGLSWGAIKAYYRTIATAPLATGSSGGP